MQASHAWALGLLSSVSGCKEPWSPLGPRSCQLSLWGPCLAWTPRERERERESERHICMYIDMYVYICIYIDIHIHIHIHMNLPRKDVPGPQKYVKQWPKTFETSPQGLYFTYFCGLGRRLASTRHCSTGPTCPTLADS